MRSNERVSSDKHADHSAQASLVAQAGSRREQTAQGKDPVARRRKQRSELIMLNEGVPINPGLPPVDFAGGRSLRRKSEVALRALCVMMTAIKADRMHQTMVLRVVRQYGLAASFSPGEKNFIRELEPTDNEKSQFALRYEAAWVLLWALGYVDHLDPPSARCDADRAVEIMREHSTQSFISDAQLRPIDQLLDQADLAYRYHCTLTDIAAAEDTLPDNLNAAIVFERQHAFNWLVRYSDCGWDEATAGAD